MLSTSQKGNHGTGLVPNKKINLDNAELQSIFYTDFLKIYFCIFELLLKIIGGVSVEGVQEKGKCKSPSNMDNTMKCN